MKTHIFGWLLFILVAPGCATSPSDHAPTTKSADSQADTVATKEADSKAQPDHLALIPNLPGPDHVQTEIRHDFNGDGVLDLALVTVPPRSRGLDGNEAERILTLGIRDGNAYRSVQSTECVALCPQCGGIMGDPYQGVDKGQDGSITVHNYGGSRHRWSVSYTIAWHADAFHVVRIKRTSFDSLKPNTEEGETVDLRTGTRVSTDPKAEKTHTKKPVRIETCGGTDPI